MSLLSLPRELQLLILGLLPVRDLLRLSETCRSLKDLARDPSLWKHLVLFYKNIKNNPKACREHVARCSKLKELTIIHSYDPYSEATSYEQRKIRSDKIMSVVMKAKNTLTSLSVSDLELCNSSFGKISQMTKLTRLDINAAKIQGLHGLSTLTCLSKLKSLNICQLHDEGDIFHSFNALLYSLSQKQLEEVEVNGHRGYQQWTKIKKYKSISFWCDEHNTHHFCKKKLLRRTRSY